MKLHLGMIIGIGLCLSQVFAANPTASPAASVEMNVPTIATSTTKTNTASSVTTPSATQATPVKTAAATTASNDATASKLQPAAPANGVLTADKPIYTLRLNSNPTTGYSWFIVSYPKDLLTIVSHQYVAPSAQMPGAGGVDVWQFQASEEAFNAPRVIKITMMYARPWEINDQTPKQSFYIVTQ